MLTVTSPKAVGEIIKVMIVYRRQQHHAGPLDNLVLKGWFADRSLLASLLINPHPLNRWCFIAVVAQSVVKITQIVCKVLGIHLCRYLIHPRCTPFAGSAIGRHQKVIVQQMIQVVKHQIWIILSLFGNSLEFH
jgi:hypothetical protein